MKRVNQEVIGLVQYVKNATPEELMDDYGVELLENGEIFDIVENYKFKTVQDWAEALVSDVDEDDYYTNKKQRSRSYDDDE